MNAKPKDTSLSGSATDSITGTAATLRVERGSESWQFFAFVFVALLAIAFAFIDEIPNALWRVGLKIAASLAIGYFTLLNHWGRKFLVTVLIRFKKVEAQ